MFLEAASPLPLLKQRLSRTMPVDRRRSKSHSDTFVEALHLSLQPLPKTPNIDSMTVDRGDEEISGRIKTSLLATDVPGALSPNLLKTYMPR